MKYILALIILVSTISSALSTTHEDIGPQIESFFSYLQDSKVDEAVNQLFEGTALAEKSQDKITIVKTQIKTAYRLYGNPLGYSFIFSQPYGDSIYKLVYSQNFKSIPLIWTFFFYRTGNEWRITNIDFNDQFNGL